MSDPNSRPAYDFAAQRLFVAEPLAAGATVALDRAASNYVLSVLRLRDGDEILAFNGRDGEWRARVNVAGRKAATLDAIAMQRPQPASPDLVLLFAPLKQARLDYVVQKAVEMGAGRLVPVLTARGQVRGLNPERLRRNAIEAAEQCGILAVPEIAPEQPLAAALDALEPARLLVFCDENAPSANPLGGLADATGEAGLAVLIGPEGGFAEAERDRILARPATRRILLGPRILRADTAAVAALAIVQASLGDWR